MKLQLRIVSPEKEVLREEVDEILAPTITGQIGILPNHASLLTELQPGECIVKQGNTTRVLGVTGGFLEVQNNTVTILADYAIRSEDVEVTKALEAKKRAEKLMQDAKERASETDFVLAEAELQKALLELRVADKIKVRRSTPQIPNQ